MINDQIEVNVAGGLEVPLPKMLRIRQKFQTPKLGSVSDSLIAQLADPGIRDQIKPGMKIAVGCGSRGIANLAECVGALISELKSIGAKPFIFPAMGSHGAATAEGQVQVLADLGLSEVAMGCPVKSSMEVVDLGKLSNGMPVYFDKYASEADGIVVVNRIKPHTNFRGPLESGLIKMLAIGAGKTAGATEFHWHGMDTFKELLPESGEFIMARKNFLFGVAMVENAADETALVEIVPGEKILKREPDLLEMAKELMPKLHFDAIDVLVVDRMGKNVTGAGMDPNITGRNVRSVEWGSKPLVHKIVALGLTPETAGNAAGVSFADVITMRLYREIDITKTYSNLIAASVLEGAAIPMIMNTDRDAVHLATRALIRTRPQDARIVHIANTLELIDIAISENLLPYVKENPDKFEIVSETAPMAFDSDGKLLPMPSRL